MESFDPDSLSDYNLCIVITCTWEGGMPPPSAVPFVLWLIDESRDFRIHKTQLAHLRFAVVGLGNSVYGENFGKCAREIDAALRALSAIPILPLTLLDQDSARDMHLQFIDWTQRFWKTQNLNSTPPPSQHQLQPHSIDTKQQKEKTRNFSLFPSSISSFHFSKFCELLFVLN